MYRDYIISIGFTRQLVTRRNANRDYANWRKTTEF